MVQWQFLVVEWSLRNEETQKEGTDPYCPAVGALPSDEIQLKVKGGEELPARSGRLQIRCLAPVE